MPKQRRSPLVAAVLLAPLALLGAACGTAGDGEGDGSPVTGTAQDLQADALATCRAGDPVATGERLRIASTVAPITSMVANVAGGLADITGLVPEGTNSHTFEPPPSVAATLAGSNVVFANGLVLEEPTKDLAEENLPDGAVMCELGTAVLPADEYIYDFSFPLEGGRPNPHLWTDPTLARRYTELIRDVLAAMDPQNGPAYRVNADAYLARLDQLDAAVRTATATIPPDQRTLLTYHDAYAYFSVTYGWEVIGAIQPSDFAQPTAKEVAQLIQQLKAEKIPAIFGSEVFPSKILEQIKKEAGVQFIDTLSDDALPGAENAPNHTYIGMMVEDTVTMAKVLGGKPELIANFDVTNPFK